MEDLRTQLEELKKRLEALEESIDPVDEVMLSIKMRLKKKLESLPELDEEKAARTLKALANPDRIRILKMLSEKPMGFKEIKEALGVESPTVSHHLKLLVKTRMVRKGDKYEISPDGRLFLRLLEIITALEEVEE
ncbi:ArsR family transcriptional regulator [Thermococcus sp. GR7]|uniref:ArsR/SmtB family transcription factor n=1 Tax=unclassified Thermococcus TaxID=2627626 RepID=UPI001430A01E|nr:MULTISPECIES: metalloregulator ArsR/SmtB family transcription factor [unclassified Thermococcus]NJD99454.1 ArsR family transcriptional regulator [Thermococcus sp. LS1]NJE47400.1 ArsR family transcriptional regulator [Thermococcus sp. GR7]NJE78895.1 ArsR family transcriptional regulator [Thermococcus sp. GR4]NJF23110.1 ArsR family transcriptional regulator [Thermococcus sp. GR5]